jgi:ribosomal protein L37AE/L43A
MQRYLCPSCGQATEAPLDRVVWCVECGQPLTVADLMPVQVSIRREEQKAEVTPAP